MAWITNGEPVPVLDFDIKMEEDGSVTIRFDDPALTEILGLNTEEDRP